MARAFATWIEGLLGPHGLVVFESNDPAAKPLVADVFARELASPGRTSALATDAGARFSAIGHSPQVVPQPDSVPLFRLDGGRRAIRRQGDQLPVAIARIPSIVCRARVNESCGLQPECAAQAARPGHALPHYLLRRGPERARVSRPAQGCLRNVRPAHAVDFSARDRHPARLRCRTVSREVLGADSKTFSRRMNLRSIACWRASCRPRWNSRCATPNLSFSRAWPESPRRCPRSTRRSRARPTRRWERCSTNCRPYGTRSSTPPNDGMKRCDASSHARRRRHSRTGIRRSASSAWSTSSTSTVPAWWIVLLDNLPLTLGEHSIITL